MDELDGRRRADGRLLGRVGTGDEQDERRAQPLPPALIVAPACSARTGP
jgi:hypothetical protein